MGSLTDFTEKKILDHVFKVASYSPPAGIYLGLSTADPLDTGAGWANPTYTGYARKALTFGAAASRAVTQSGVVTFDPCTVGSSICTHWGIWDQLATGGNLMAHGVLAAPKTIVVGNTPSVASGQAVITYSAAGVFTLFANSILDWLFRAQALAQPTNVKLALSTTIPTDDGPNITEPLGNGYAQKTFNTWNAGAGSPTLVDNFGDAAFDAASGSWGTIVYGVAYGDMTPMFYLDITDQAVGNGDTVKFLTGDFNTTQD